MANFARNLSKYIYEEEWLKPSEDSMWLKPEPVRVSTLINVRWLNRDINACLNIEVMSPPDNDAIVDVQEELGYLTKWWEESIFILLNSEDDVNWAGLNLPEPDFVYLWNNNLRFCGWYHYRLKAEVRIGQMEPDDEPDEETINFRKSFEENKEQKELWENQLIPKLKELKCDFVEPRKARHMVAVLFEDPFPASDLIVYPSYNLIWDFETIPSPIDPNSRAIHYTICYDLGNTGYNYGEIEQRTNEIIRFEYSNVESLEDHFDLNFEVDNKTFTKTPFLILHLDYKRSLGQKSTNEFLNEVVDFLNIVLNSIENNLKLDFPSIKRDTEKYWNMEYFIYFP